jgi:hypothetical protein
MSPRKSPPGSDEPSGAHSRPGGFCAGQSGSAREKRPAILANVGYAGITHNPNTEPTAKLPNEDRIIQERETPRNQSAVEDSG